MTLAPGTLLQQRYRIDRRLGQGGFGTVYLGEDVLEERRCAIKILTRLDPDSVGQFDVEADLLRRIRSPHVPRIYAAFSLAGSNERALVMEYIPGQSVGEQLQQGAPLPERQALLVALHVLEALIHLHSQEHPIIHRDIKPDNMKLDPDGNAWLLDLGIGKSLDRSTMRAAHAATVDYAPLEQLQYQPTDQRSDLFALGASLYHLMTGQPPEDALQRQMGNALTAPTALRTGLSPGCVSIIERALRMDPADRYQSATAMHRDVEALLDPDVPRRFASAAQLRDALSRGQAHSIKATHILPPQQAVVRSVAPALPGALDLAMRDMLGQTGPELKLYSHQAESLERARKKRDIVVVTGTASGKSLCFNLPVLERCINDHRAHALYLFPIKALINDQAEKLNRLGASIARFGGPPISAARLHGDLNPAERQALRQTPPRIALSNPDFVHWMLARHTDWRSLFVRLQFIVLDEVHVYRGLFGSHVAMLLRRLRRICAHYGADPQFICCSATVKNPVELVARLTGTPEERLHLIDRDGAARVRRHIHFWEPPTVGEDQRRAVDGEAVSLTLRAVQAGKQVITFARARQEVEQLLARTRSAAKRNQLDATLYSAYRGGYTRLDRERIEQALRSRQVRGLFATSALEMGIDIGSLQMSVLTGFPGSRMSFWQQAGRAGRQHEDAHVVLIGGPNPMDGYYLKHPEVLLYGPSEEAIVDLDNRYIAEGHLRCMAREWPLQAHELPGLPQETRIIFDQLVQAGTLVAQPGLQQGVEYVYSGADLPHSKVNLRSVNSENYEIVCQGQPEPLGTIAPPQLYREAHEGALYYYLGEDYRVKRVDTLTRKVSVVPEPVRISPKTNVEEGKRITRAKIRVQIQTQQPFETTAIGAGRATARCQFGTVQVIEIVEGYKELWLHNLEKIAEFQFLQPIEQTPLVSKGFWLDIAADIQVALFYNGGFNLDPNDNALRVALHGLEHLLLGLVPTVALCDRRDLGSQFIELFGAQPSIAQVFIYDPVPGGIGYAERAYRNIDTLLRRAYDVVAHCACQAGCPYCIHAGWCYQDNQHLDKQATILLLEYMLELRPVPVPANRP